MSGRAFDHLVLAAHDLAAQAAFFSRLGFTLTPRARHPWGTENHLIQMQGSFLELLGLPAPAAVAGHDGDRFSFAAFIGDYLRRRQGLAMLVFRTADAAADRAQWQARGLRIWDLFDFRREAPLPEGRTVPVAFTLAFVTHAAMPEAGFFVCQQHYPENFWRSDFQRHANGARGIPGVSMVARDPAALAGFFSALIGEGCVTHQGTALSVDCGGDRLRILDPAGYATAFPGLRWPDDGAEPRFAALEVAADLGLCHRLLRAAGIAPVDDGGRLWIGPDAGFGTVIEFIAGS